MEDQSQDGQNSIPEPETLDPIASVPQSEQVRMWFYFFDFMQRQNLSIGWEMHEQSGQLRTKLGLEKRRKLVKNYENLIRRERGEIPKDLDNTLRRHRQAFVVDSSKRMLWGDATTHCMLEAARADILGELLGLPEEQHHNLCLGAMIHDARKLPEILATNTAHFRYPEKTEWDENVRTTEETREFFRNANIPEEAIIIALSTRHHMLPERLEIVRKEELQEHEIARLCLCFIDDYTRGSSWVELASDAKDGTILNDLDRRIQMNRERYAALDAESIDHFNRPAYDIQEEAGDLIQTRLASLISERSGIEIPPKKLPEYIDQMLRKRIG